MHECRNAPMHDWRMCAFVHLCIRAFLFLLLASVPLAQEADRARTEALAARASARMDALHREADQLASQERTLLGDLRRLELERQIKLEELRQLDTQAAALERELTAITARF